MRGQELSPLKPLRDPMRDNSVSPIYSHVDENIINLKNIQTVKETFAGGIESNGDNVCLVVGYRDDLIQLPTDPPKSNDKATAETKDSANKINVQTMKIAFETIDGWLKQHFKIQDQKASSTGQT